MNWLVAIVINILVIYSNKINLYGFSINNEAKILFDLADVKVIEINENHVHEIKAFKYSNNIEIINKKDELKYSQLEWATIGAPKPIPSFLNENNSTLFINFTPEGFHINVQMLTELQAKLIVKEIKLKYNIKVRVNQIHNIPLSKFECQSRLINSNGTEYSIKGKVSIVIPSKKYLFLFYLV